MAPREILKKIYAIAAQDIPDNLHDACEEVDGEFPWHYAYSVIFIDATRHTNNDFVKWLVTQGMVIPKSGRVELAVCGT